MTKLLESIERTISPSSPQRRDAGQYMTPDWAADELVRQYFGDLTLCDAVVEPTCGEGAFLRALPDHVPACGVELDPLLAARAAASSGRRVIIGDFRTAELPLRPTAVIGNPPFRSDLVHAILDRAWDLLPVDGRVGLILPCSIFGAASTVHRLSARWGMQQDMLPRNLFRRLSMPICFAVLTKGSGRKLFGFSLYHEAHAVSQLQRRYRELLSQGERSAWRAVTRAAFERLGGRASLCELYREIEGDRPTANPFWHAKVRQVVQSIAIREGRGEWRLPLSQERMAA